MDKYVIREVKENDNNKYKYNVIFEEFDNNDENNDENNDKNDIKINDDLIYQSTINKINYGAFSVIDPIGSTISRSIALSLDKPWTHEPKSDIIKIAFPLGGPKNNIIQLLNNTNNNNNMVSGNYNIADYWDQIDNKINENHKKNPIFNNLFNAKQATQVDYDEFRYNYMTKKAEDELINYNGYLEKDLAALKRCEHEKANTYAIDEEPINNPSDSLVTLAQNDLVDRIKTSDIIMFDKHSCLCVRADKKKYYYVEIKKNIHILSMIYLKIECINKCNFDLQDLNMNELFSLSFELTIGGGSPIQLNFPTILFQSAATNNPIEFGVNYIKVPLYVYDKLAKLNGIPVCSLQYHELAINIHDINNFDHDYDLLNTDSYILSFDIVGYQLKNYSNLFRFEFPVLQSKNVMNRYKIVDYYQKIELCSKIPFLLFSIVPLHSMQGENASIFDCPISINKIYLKINEKSVNEMEFSDELIYLDSNGISMCILSFDPMITTIDDIGNLYETYTETREEMGIQFPSKNITFRVDYESMHNLAHSYEEFNNNYGLSVTTIKYNELRIMAGMAGFASS